MKRCLPGLSIIVFTCASAQVLGQVDRDPVAAATPEAGRKGYIGMTVGLAVPAREDTLFFPSDLNTGIQVNLVQGGYLFTRSLGFTGSVCLSHFASPDKYQVIVGSLMIGPMLSIPAKKLNVDFRPQIGYSLSVPYGGFFFIYGSAVSFSMGVNLRYHPLDNLSILVGVDYFSTSPEIDIDGDVYTMAISTLNLTAGIAVRLR